MLVGELLSLLNTRARELGIKLVSPRTLEDWIEEEYFEGPTPKGRQRGLNPEWQYTSEAAERGLAVVQLRAKKVRRAAATRLGLFLLGFGVSPAQIKDDLRSEFSRLLRRHFFRRPWVYEAYKGKGASDAERQKQLKRVGEIDSRLVAAGFRAPDATILDAGSAIFLGIAGDEGLLPTLRGVLDSIPFLTAEFKQDIIEDLRPYAEILGLFGDPEEIEGSGLDNLKKCSDDDIQSGRDLYQFVLSLNETFANLSKLWKSESGTKLRTALEATVATFRDSEEWPIAILGAGAVAAFRRRLGRK